MKPFKMRECPGCHGTMSHSPNNPPLCPVAAARFKESSKRWAENNRERVRDKQRGRNKAYRARHGSAFMKQSQRRNHLRREYQITPEEYAALWAAQKGLCAICQQAPVQRDVLDVDHDHVTEFIRGLLCGPCNKGLGFLGDNVDRLFKAIAYLNAARNRYTASTCA